jgi:hypothetical protein
MKPSILLAFLWLAVCSSAVAEVITNGAPIDVARKAMAAAAFKRTGLDLVAKNPDEEFLCWGVDEGVLVIGYYRTTRVISGLWLQLSDERPKSTRKTFQFDVVSFDTHTGLMTIRTRKGEQDGAGNSHRTGQ